MCVTVAVAVRRPAASCRARAFQQMSSTVACTPGHDTNVGGSSGTESNLQELHLAISCSSPQQHGFRGVKRRLKQQAANVTRSSANKGPSTFLVGNTSPGNTMSPGIFAAFIVVALFAFILVFSSCIVWFITERRKLSSARKLYLKAKNEASNPVAKSDVSVQCDGIEVRVLLSLRSLEPYNKMQMVHTAWGRPRRLQGHANSYLFPACHRVLQKTAGSQQ